MAYLDQLDKSHHNLCLTPRHPSSLCPESHLTLQFSQSCLSSLRNSKGLFSVWSVPNSQSAAKSLLTWPANTLFLFLLYWRPGSPWQHCFPAALSCQMAAIFPHYPWTMFGVGSVCGPLHLLLPSSASPPSHSPGSLKIFVSGWFSISPTLVSQDFSHHADNLSHIFNSHFLELSSYELSPALLTHSMP